MPPSSELQRSSSLAMHRPVMTMSTEMTGQTSNLMDEKGLSQVYLATRPLLFIAGNRSELLSHFRMQRAR